MSDPYLQALTHPSWTREEGDPSYQRLEFLGDAVLQLAVTELLYQTFPEADEGTLTDIRQRMVVTSRLAKISRALGLEEHLRLGRGARRDAHQLEERVLADAFEAMLGALYLDMGMDAAREVIYAHLSEDLRIDPRTLKNAKNLLQEWSQEHHKLLPSYQLLKSEGPAHDLRFTASVEVDHHIRAQGEGRSRKAAETAAARAALEALGLL